MVEEDGHNIVVNSFAGKARGENTKKSIGGNMGWIPIQNIFIVNNRKKKWVICNEQKLHIMVDDRLDVLEAIEENFKIQKLKCPILIWFSNEKTRTRYIQVSSWKQLYSTIRNLHKYNDLKK